MAKKEDDSLEGLLTGIRKEHGAGSIMLLGETPLEPVEVIPTGSFTLDEALRVGGFGRGRIIEIYGPESSGKTSIALHAVGNAQKQGLLAAFIDAEHAIDPEWAAVLGVDTDKLLVSQPDHGEQALSITEKLCRSGKVGIIVVDSVAALVPRAEIEGEMGDSHMGLHARLMSQALRKITGVASDSKTTVIFINQLRDKIGVMFGSPETTTGGKALKFYASVRLDVRKVEILKEGTVPVGHRVRVKVVKNKLGPPFGSAEFDFLTGEGISREAEVLDLGVERGVIGKGGSWFTFEGSNLGNGKLAAVRSMKADPERASRISAAVSAAAGAKTKPAKSATALDMSGEAPWEAEETGV